MAGEIRDLELKSKTKDDAGTRMLDGDGLVGTVRADRSGRVTVSFTWRYRSPTTGKVRDIVCGVWPEKTLKEVRSVRDRFRLMVKDGADPAETKKADKLAAKADQEEAILREKSRIEAVAAAKARITVKQAFEKWELHELVARKDKGVTARRAFEKDIFPYIGDVAAEDVTRAMLTDCLYRVVERGSRSMARHLCAEVKQFFSYAEGASLIPNDPAVKLKKEKFGEKTERTRHLNENEIRALSVQLPQSGIKPANQAALWIALSTCCRIGEIIKARWEHIDTDAGVWRIPLENAKNDNAFMIHLSPFALKQFKILKEHSGKSGWVLPATNRTKGDIHVCEKSITKQVNDRQLSDDRKPLTNRCKKQNALILPGGEGKWTPHDLRRTGSTLMVSLGVRPDIAKLAGNHVEQDAMKRIYIQHEYTAELKEAWRRLGAHLEVLTTPKDGAEQAPERSE